MEELDLKQLALAVKTISEEKNLPEEVVLDVIEQAIAVAWRRDHGEKSQEVRSKLDLNTGEAEVFVAREVVEEVLNPATEIDLKEARQQNKKAELGDVVEEKFEVTSFGRVAAQTAKQVIVQRLREAEREVVLAEFEDKIGTVISGTVLRVEPRVVRVDVGKTVGVLLSEEQPQGEFYTPGARIRVLVKSIEKDNRGPQLILSRSDEKFVEYLFEQEVPEIETGAVSIKAIAREAGRRTKLAVESTIPSVDPVGTFVGGHGTRVQSVMNEIGDQEKIDIIAFSQDITQFIKNALSPAEVDSLEIDEKNHQATVFVAEDQQSIAIGRSGQNVRLASRLTGYELDIKPVVATKAKTKTPKAPAKNIEDDLMAALDSSAQED